jgi:hypothetical protein
MLILRDDLWLSNSMSTSHLHLSSLNNANRFFESSVLRFSPLACAGTCVFEAPVARGTASCVAQRGYHKHDTAG